MYLEKYNLEGKTVVINGGGAYCRCGPTPEHPALANRSDIWINPIVKMIHKAIFWHCIK